MEARQASCVRIRLPMFTRRQGQAPTPQPTRPTCRCSTNVFTSSAELMSACPLNSASPTWSQPTPTSPGATSAPPAASTAPSSGTAVSWCSVRCAAVCTAATAPPWPSGP